MRRFEEHIDGCDACTEYLGQFKRTIELTGTLTPGDLTPEAESTLLGVFRSWSSQQPASQQPGVTEPDR